MGEIPCLWVRYHGRYWYQSFIDGSNIWDVDRTDPWGPEMHHPPLGRSHLVVVPSYDVMCLDSLSWALWFNLIPNIYINLSSMGPIFAVWIGPSLRVPKSNHPPLDRSNLVVVPSYDMSCTLNVLTGLYGWDSMADVDINPYAMGPIFGVWIGPTLGVPRWTIRYRAIW